MAENKLADMSPEFAVKILNLTDGIKGHYSFYPINLKEAVQASVQTSERQSMPTAKRISLQNYRFLSKSVMKQSIGSRLRKKQISFLKKLQTVFCTIAVLSAEC